LVVRLQPFGGSKQEDTGNKFRSTYGTMMLRKYDISTVRKMMGA